MSAFVRVAKYIYFQKAKLLYQSFVASTFKYSPLIWIFCGKIANDIVDRVHHRSLRILQGDHESTFEALLAKNDETNIHTQNLRVLMIEIYKTLNNANPPFMQEYFIGKDVKYDLRTRDFLCHIKSALLKMFQNIRISISHVSKHCRPETYCSVFKVPRLRRERIRKYVSVLYFSITRLLVFYHCSNIIGYRGNTQYNVHSF